MKNKLNVVLLIISFSIVIFILLLLHILGSYKRTGYLSDFKFDEWHIYHTLELNNLSSKKYEFIIDGKLDEENIKNYIFTNENITNYSYGFRIKYYNKIFRNSDIYGVNIDTNKIIDDYNYIKEVRMDSGGTPFGNLISDKKIDFDKIDNIDYKLFIKFEFLIVCIVSLVILFLLYFIYVNKNVLNKYIDFNTKESDYEKLNFFTKYKINNLLFTIYLIVMSFIVFSSFFINNLFIDEWIYSNYYNAFYQIYDFSGHFWQRGRHFADILMALNMRPFGNILITLFNIEPITVQKITSSFFIVIYFYLFSISISILVWMLNNKNNFKLIFILISLYSYILCVKINNYIFIASYIGTAGFSLLMFLPIIYYFYYDKELLFLKNRKLYYALYLFLIYFTTFTLEPISLEIAGLSLFIIIYFFIVKKLFSDSKIKNININILLMLSLIIILSSVSFYLTLFKSGRGDMQLNKVENSSLLSSVYNLFNGLYFFEKILILLSILYVFYLLILFIKKRKIEKVDYIAFSIIFVSVLGIFGFFCIQVPNVEFQLLLLYSVFISILLKLIHCNTKILSYISSILIMAMVFSLSIKMIGTYDEKTNLTVNPRNDYEKTLINIYKNADINNYKVIIISKEDLINYNLSGIGLSNSENYILNGYISSWMYRYGYTKKYIPIKLE
ncbi:hypothetical protein [Brachyspira intermedia]|uniref:hypothetical protein n=1 Tax=Brachyspira intermedia TaxID=84377 RepID=UPI003003D69F